MNVINRKRVQFILDEFADKGKSAHDIFKCNEKYITDMLTAAVIEPLNSDKKIFLICTMH